jgi:hypothetical protein
MKTAVPHDSSRAIPYCKNWSSELAVVVIPLTAWRTSLNGIPKFDLKGRSNLIAHDVYKDDSQRVPF